MLWYHYTSGNPLFLYNNKRLQRKPKKDNYKNASGDTAWMVGIARRIITPSTDVWLAGYGVKRPAEGKIHDIWAKVLALLEKSYPGVTAMFFNACGGDQDPLPRRTVTLCEQYGKMLSDAVEEVIAKPMEPVSSRLQTRSDL